MVTTGQDKQPEKIYIPLGHSLDGFHDIYSKRLEYSTGEWIELDEFSKLMEYFNEQESTSKR